MHLQKCGGFLTILLLAASACTRGPSDETIAAQIKAKFYGDPIVKPASLTVTVAKGEVTLGGTASTVEVELQAFKLATSVQGVRRIHDEIVVTPASDKPQPAAFQGNAAEDARQRRVTVAAASREADYVLTAPPTPEEVRIPEAPAAAEPVVEAPDPPSVAVVVVAAAKPVELYRPPLLDSSEHPSERAPNDRSKPHERIQLTAAGSDRPAEVYQRWFSEFSTFDPNTDIHFQAGTGLRLFLDRRADFAVSGSPMTDEQLEQRRALHFPVAVMGIAIICNIEGKVRELNLSGEVLASIYLGQITRWDHPAIHALNPRGHLPYGEIVLVHRSDSSHATTVFTQFLSIKSADWRAQAKFGPVIAWPSPSLGGKGDEGLAQLVKQTPNSIGYIDASWAMQNSLKVCAIQNRAGGQFVKPAPQTLSAAAAAALIPAGFRVSLVDATSGYPMSTFTWILVPDNLGGRERREVLASLLQWILTRGQAYSETMGYGAIPKELAEREQAMIRKLRQHAD